MLRRFHQVLFILLSGVVFSAALSAASAAPSEIRPRAVVPSEASLVDDGAWNEILPLTGRTDHSAVYDPLGDRMVVFGGWNGRLWDDVLSLSLGQFPAWTELSPGGVPPAARGNHTAIYDPVRHRMIVFGGIAPYYRNDVWELSLGASPTWTQLTPSGTPPSARRSHTAIYDPIGDRMIVFGGMDGAYLNDVWALSLDGPPAWTQLTPTGTPPGVRAEHTALFDPVRARMIVFGGTDGGYRNDVWALSLGGTPAWTQLTPTGAPPSGRSEHAAVYDPGQDRMVVYGEYDDHQALLCDMWALSLGSSPEWTSIIPPGDWPSGRWGLTAVYDADDNRMVVYGGDSNYANDVWAFSLGVVGEWTELTPAGSPPSGRSYHTAIYDPIRDRMIVCCGYPLLQSQVWALPLGGDPAWVRLAPTGVPPVARKNATAIYDPVRDRMIMFGGFLNFPDAPTLRLCLNDTWALSLGQDPAWTEIIPSGSTKRRDAHTAIYDPVRDRMIIFGGYGGYYQLDVAGEPVRSPAGEPYTHDVWELTLGESPTWTELFPTGPLPESRARHSAIYDPVRDRMIVFGGYKVDYTCFDDVWALSLSGDPAWTLLFPSGTPPTARGRHSAIYDPLRDRMIVFGAYNCGWRYMNDTWTLSLSGSPAWSELAPTGTLPSIRSGHSAVYDPVRDRMVVFGGNATFHINDTWALVWGTGSCAVPEIVSFDPSLVTPENCADGCTVDFVIDIPPPYTDVTKVILERYREGTWVPEDSILAPLPAGPWTLSCVFDEHFTDGEHVFHAVTRCVDGSRGVSETATVTVDRGVPVAIRRFELGLSDEGVLLRWAADQRLGLQGFNVYKSSEQQENFVRVNSELIPPGGSNTYADGDVEPGTTYWYSVGAVYTDGEWMSSTERIAIPTFSPVLRQNIPNPFNPTTSISFAVPTRSRVRVDVYDVEGRHVKTLFDDVVDAGSRTTRWDGTNAEGDHVGSGVYFYRLRTADTLLTKKMVLLK